MAVPHSTVPLSPQFPQAYSGELIQSLVRTAEIAQPQLGPCWFDDGEEICSQPGTVHLLGSDWEFCEKHFRQVSRG